MLVRNRKSEITFECDDCGVELETETRDFEEARTALKGSGWQTKKDGDEWLHYCTDCRD